YYRVISDRNQSCHRQTARLRAFRVSMVQAIINSRRRMESDCMTRDSVSERNLCDITHLTLWSIPPSTIPLLEHMCPPPPIQLVTLSPLVAIRLTVQALVGRSLIRNPPSFVRYALLMIRSKDETAMQRLSAFQYRLASLTAWNLNGKLPKRATTGRKQKSFKTNYIVGCVEQRLTGFVIGLLVALSVIVEAQLFALIPMGALYGMFMYMGIMGLRELVVVRRLLALLKRRKHWRDREYLRHLPAAALASFVAVQMGFIVLLLALNWTTEFARIGATSLLFPFILLLFGVVREFVLPRFRLLRSYLHEMDRLHNLHLPRNHRFHRNCCHCSEPLHPHIRGDSLSESRPRNLSKLHVVSFLQRENQSIIADQLAADDSREHFSKAGATSRLAHTAWTVSSELDHLVSKDERPSFKYNSWTRLSVPHPSGSPVDVARNAEGSRLTNVDADYFVPARDVPSSSLSLSSVEEYSESELELRLDNPYCLD
ncbi:anion exchange protein 3, partial [Clonorchis sinensis]